MRFYIGRGDGGGVGGGGKKSLILLSDKNDGVCLV